MLLFAVGCSNDIEEAGTTPGGTIASTGLSSSQDATARAGKDLPDLFQVTLGPPNATKSSSISLEADRSVLYGGNISWYVNGQLVGQRGGTRLSYKGLSRGDVIKAVIVKDSGEEISSNELVIKNSPPTIQQAEVRPKFPMVGVAPKVKVWGHDIDGDKVSFEYQWYVNDKPHGRWSVLEVAFTRSDKIKVEITPYDGLNYGKTITLRPIVANAPPIITGNKGAYDGGVYKNQLVVDDPDNDSLAFELIEAPDGMKIDSGSGLITWPVVLEAEETYYIKVRVSDGHGGSSVYAFEVTTLLEKPGGE